MPQRAKSENILSMEIFDKLHLRRFTFTESWQVSVEMKSKEGGIICYIKAMLCAE